MKFRLAYIRGHASSRVPGCALAECNPSRVVYDTNRYGGRKELLNRAKTSIWCAIV